MLGKVNISISEIQIRELNLGTFALHASVI